MSSPYMGLSGDDQVRSLLSNPRSKTFARLKQLLTGTDNELGASLSATYVTQDQSIIDALVFGG